MSQQTQFLAQPLRRAGTLGAAFALCFPMTYAAQAAPAASRSATLAAYGKDSHSTTAVSASAIAHWQTIAQGNVPQLMTDYSPEAVFHWKEGAFEGNHVGVEDIRTVWIKFAKVRSPLTLTMNHVQEKGGPEDTRIVTADVTFRNTDWTYALAYRLVFRKGQIVEETWQLAEPDTDPGQV